MANNGLSEKERKWKREKEKAKWKEREMNFLSHQGIEINGRSTASNDFNGWSLGSVGRRDKKPVDHPYSAIADLELRRRDEEINNVGDHSRLHQLPLTSRRRSQNREGQEEEEEDTQ